MIYTELGKARKPWYISSSHYSRVMSDTSAMISTVVESILYGFSVLMFMGTMWTLTHKHRTQKVNRAIAVVTIMLLILSTAHMVLVVIRLYDGLVKYRDTFPGGPPAFFSDFTQETFVIKTAIYIVQTLLGDGVVIYRCYVVWQSFWIIVLPSILWCSVGVTGYFGLYRTSQTTDDAGDPFILGTAFFASTLATNILSSGLLAYRIWIVECRVSTARATASSLMPVLRVLVDAAILYTVTLLPVLVCFVLSNGTSGSIDIIIPIISIAFYMVLIRIAIRRPQDYLFRGGASSDTERGNPRQLAMKPLQVHISQFTHHDGTSAYVVEK